MTESIASLRQQLQADRVTLRDGFTHRKHSRPHLAHESRLVDHYLQLIWKGLDIGPSVLLIAVGGYGRGQLYPCSDIDLLILLPDNAAESTLHKVEQFIGQLWDMGLEVGHSVRTLAECLTEAAGDITVLTTQLETRLLVGSHKLYNQFCQATHRNFSPKEFFEAKQVEQQQRHERFQGGGKLEPNVKEAPGGLRDLHLIMWIAEACGVGHTWDDLVREGIMTPVEKAKISRAERMLQTLRIRLHLIAKRREDRLLFDFQNPLAKQYGFTDNTANRASEQLMAIYYRAARIVNQLTPILMLNLRRRIYSRIDSVVREITPRFKTLDSLLDITELDVFEKDPSAIFEAFLLLQQHPELTGMSSRTLRGLWHARKLINPAFRRDPRNKALFMEIMRQPRGTTRALRRMNLLGVLGRYIPAFGKIVGLMQHDLFHVYTVDEHIMMVVRNLRRFATPAFNHEYPLCSKLIEDFERPEVIFLAGLFHDIAKGRGGDHSALGQVDALRFCRSHALLEEDSQLVAWLVSHHLTMSQITQKEDVYDPEVIARFARLVGDMRHLTALYLLTVADIRGTSPKVWNGWKAKLLEDLFVATRRVLQGQNHDVDTYLEMRQEEARKLMQLYGLRPDAHAALWKSLDTVYFMRHDAREIAWHARVLHARHQTDEPIVRARVSEGGDGLQILVYTPDQPDLFARICSFFERAGYSILDAKIYTTKTNFALDSFFVFSPDNPPGHYRDVVSYVEFELAQAIARAGELPPPRSGRISRQVKHFPLDPQVQIRPDDRQKFHILTIVASDRPGLLYRIARILSQHHVAVQSAKISTLGERAEDTFQISGHELSDAKRLVTVETDLLHSLQG